MKKSWLIKMQNPFRGTRFAVLDMQNIRAGLGMKLAILAIMLIPLAYGALYIWAFQDPYGHLNSIPVAIVNQDEGATLEDGTTVNVGNELVDELKDNDDGMQWNFVDQADAEKGLENRKYYMALNIPQDFSKKVISAEGANPQKAIMVLRQNQSENIIAAQLGKAVFHQVNAALNTSIEKEYYDNIFMRIDDIGDGLQTAADGSGELATGLKDAEEGSNKLHTGLGTAHSGSATLTSGLYQLAAGTDTAVAGGEQLSDGAGQLSAGLTTLKEGTSELSLGAQTLHGKMGEAQQGAHALQGGAQQLESGVNKLAAGADALVGDPSNPDPSKQGLYGLESGAASLEGGMTQLTSGLSTIKTGTQALSDNSSKLVGGVEKLETSAQEIADGSHRVSTGANDVAQGAHQLRQGVDGFAEGALALDEGALKLKKAVEDLGLGAGILDGNAEELEKIAKLIEDIKKGAGGAGSNIDNTGKSLQKLQAALEKLNNATTPEEQQAALAEAQAALAEAAAYAQAAGEDISNLEGLDIDEQKIANLISGGRAFVDGAKEFAEKAHLGALSLEKISTDLHALLDGTQALEDGANRVSVGAQDVADGADRFAAGAKLLRDQTAPLKTKLPELDAGVGDALNGAKKLETGANQLKVGLGAARSGAQALQAGISGTNPNQPSLRTGIAAAAAGITDLSNGIDQLTAGAGKLADGASMVNAGAGEAQAGASTLHGGAIELANGLHKLSSNTYTAASGSVSLRDGLNELEKGSGTLASGLKDAQEGADTLHDGLVDGVDTLRDKMANSDAKSDMMAGPVETEDNPYTEVENYGTGFAPYFIALGLWVGALMLTFITKPLNGRLISSGANPIVTTFSGVFPNLVIGVAQTVILLLVLQFGLKIHISHPVWMYAIALLTMITFNLITQMLVAAFGFSGRFISVILLMLQLTSAAGTFPIETTPKFFQVVSPYFPMTYVVRALREASTGVDMTTCLSCAGVLIAFAIVSFAITALIAYSRRTITLGQLNPLIDL